MRRKIMNIPYDYIVHNIGTAKEPAYKAVVPAINAIVFGDNFQELQEGIIMSIEDETNARKKEGQKMPAPERDSKLSGKLVLRINPTLHEHLALTAKARGMSLNKFIESKVSV